jgi:hypothetical protein
LGYSMTIPNTPCDVFPLTTYYLSVPCLSDCILQYALAIYTDANCTTLAPDGYYSDSFYYGSQNSGVFVFGGIC